MLLVLLSSLAPSTALPRLDQQNENDVEDIDRNHSHYQGKTKFTRIGGQSENEKTPHVHQNEEKRIEVSEEVVDSREEGLVRSEKSKQNESAPNHERQLREGVSFHPEHTQPKHEVVQAEQGVERATEEATRGLDGREELEGSSLLGSRRMGGRVRRERAEDEEGEREENQKKERREKHREDFP